MLHVQPHLNQFIMLIDNKTQKQVVENDFRVSHPNTTFPSVLTDEVIRPFGYALLHYDLPTPSATCYQKLIDAAPMEVDGKWQAQYETVDMSPEEISSVDASIQAEIINNTQLRLDKFAATKGYDSILSACTYATSHIPQFATEGQYAVSARDTTWAALYSLLGQILAGEKPMPTGFDDTEVQNILPELTWPS
jgi:hypothetical protein